MSGKGDIDITQKKEILSKKNESLGENVLETFQNLISTIDSIKNLSNADRSHPTTQYESKTEFEQFWQLFDLKVKQAQSSFQSVHDANRNMDDMNDTGDIVIMIDSYEHVRKKYSTFFKQLFEIENFCGLQLDLPDPEILDEDNHESVQTMTQEDLEMELPFTNKRESFLSNQLQNHSILMDINERLRKVLKIPLDPTVIPQLDYASTSTTSHPLTIKLESGDGVYANEIDSHTSSSSLTSSDESSTVKPKRTRKLRLKRTKKSVNVSTKNAHAVSVPSDTELIANYRRAVYNSKNCTLGPDCNCFQCYPLYLPEDSTSSNPDTIDEDDSDIDTFAVVFDLKPFKNNRKSSRYFGGRDLTEKIFEDDEPETVKRKLRTMRDNEIIRNFEKVLADSSEKSFTTLFEQMLVGVYHCFISFWQNMKKRSGKIYPSDDYKKNTIENTSPKELIHKMGDENENIETHSKIMVKMV